MRITTLLFLLATCIATGCYSAETADFENGFKFSDEVTQTAFVNSLRKEGIPHRVRDDGAVLYAAKNESRVSKIRMSVLNETFVPSVHVNDPKLEREFLERLNAAKIQHVTQEKAGKSWITWSERDSTKVEEIKRGLLESERK